MKDFDITLLNNFINNVGIKIYRDEERRIIIDGNVTIYSNEHHYFPVKIYKINGNLKWTGNMSGYNTGLLYSLVNFPDIVNGHLDISYNPYLESLKYCPKVITGSFLCNNCYITDLTGIASEIGENFDGSRNPISDIEPLKHINIKGNIILKHTNWSYKHPDVSSINNSSLIITEETKYLYTY